MASSVELIMWYIINSQVISIYKDQYRKRQADNVSNKDFYKIMVMLIICIDILL